MMMPSQKEIAQIMQVSQSMIQHILSGYRHASYPLAKKISAKTKSDVELWVRGGTGTPEGRKAAIRAWAESTRQ